jgi:DNA repair ATPase RecN
MGKMAQASLEKQDVPPYLEKTAQALRSLPNEIAKVQEKVFELSEKVNLVTEELKTIEAEIKAGIAVEINPITNKPAFSNDTVRDAEFVRRKPSDLKYMDCYIRLKDLRNEYSKVKIEAEQLANTFSATRHLADLYASWIRK